LESTAAKLLASEASLKNYKAVVSLFCHWKAPADFGEKLKGVAEGLDTRHKAAVNEYAETARRSSRCICDAARFPGAPTAPTAHGLWMGDNLGQQPPPPPPPQTVGPKQRSVDLAKAVCKTVSVLQAMPAGPRRLQQAFGRKIHVTEVEEVVKPGLCNSVEDLQPIGEIHCDGFKLQHGADQGTSSPGRDLKRLLDRCSIPVSAVTAAKGGSWITLLTPKAAEGWLNTVVGACNEAAFL
jgi:hypothetical protein